MDFYGINLKDDMTADGTPDVGTVGNPLGTVYGECTSAQWGDLAEKYRCKGDVDEGTVMGVSKDPEADMEPTNSDMQTSVIGVISMRPGFTMNDSLWKGSYVGLTGRLPVKIIGPIEKGDFIVATMGGCARAGKNHEIAHKMGVCNSSDLDAGVKLVECVIK